jgi:hypothetical protein
VHAGQRDESAADDGASLDQAAVEKFNIPLEKMQVHAF